MRKFLLLLLIIGSSTLSLGQDLLSKKIDFKVENVPISNALDKLGEILEVDIAYSNSFFRDTKPINIDVKQRTVDEILRTILKGTKVQYETLGESRVLLFIRKISYQTLSGYVEDAETGERIVGARVYSVENDAVGITNEYGFFSFQIPEGKTTLIIRSIGFKDLKMVAIDEKSLNIKLDLLDNLPEVIVDAEDKNAFVFSSIGTDQDNITVISPRFAKSVPTLNGQADFVRVADLLPGVQGQADGFGGISIRGAASGQNLMLMDGTPVYIPYHLLGLYSAYNPETVKSVKLVKGNFPARYGNAVSSVLDVRIREGNMQKWQTTANVDLISTGVTVEGPIKKEKGSVLFAGRFSPMAYFFEPTISRLYFRNQVDEQQTLFYDYSLKANYQVSKKDRIYFSLFSGKDIIRQNALTKLDAYKTFNSSFDLEWENTVGSFRWNHQFSKKLFLNTTATYSNYTHRFSSFEEFEYDSPDVYSYDVFALDNASDNRDLGGKLDFDFAISPKHQLRFGTHYNYRNFNPRFFYSHETYFDAIYEDEFGQDYDFEAYYAAIALPIYNLNETALYVEDQIKLRRWYFNAGLRFSANLGEKVVDKISYRSDYLFFEPRLLAKYRISEKMTASVSANRRMQYLHLIANQTLQLPNDIWVPSNGFIQPLEMYESEATLQYWFDKSLKLNLTGYYRLTNNLYTYPESLEFLETKEDYTNYDYLEVGTGTSKGIEFMADYADSKRGLLFTYTLSQTTQQFDSVNLGRPFAANNDSRHQVNLGFHQNLSPVFKIGVNWVYRSGTPKINVLQISNDGSFSNFDEDPPGYKNTTRIKAYNRIDINLQYQSKGEKVQHTVKVGVYNLLNTRNLAFYQFQYIDGAGQIHTSPVNSLPILPSFSYRIAF